jgi:hypothetical protein
VYFAEHVVLAAVGIDVDGVKDLLVLLCHKLLFRSGHAKNQA